MITRQIRYYFLRVARRFRVMGSGIPIATSRAEANRQAALFRLSAELAESLDDKQIYRLLANGLHDTLGYDFVAAFRVEEGSKNRYLVASAGYADPKSPLEPGEGLSEGPLLDGKVHYTKDVTAQPNYFYGVGGSEVDVPIYAKKTIIGVLVAERKLKDAFDDRDIEVLTAAANIAGLALEKAQLIAAEQKRVDQLEALRKTSQEIIGQLDLAPLLRSIVERAATLLNADGGELGLVEGDQIRIVVSSKIGSDRVDQILNLGEGLMGTVVRTGEPLLVEDYQSWPGRLPDYSEVRSAVCAPLKLGDRILGVFTSAREGDPTPFSDDDLYLLGLFAQQAVVAIENARLFEEAQSEIANRKRLQQETSRQKEFYKALLINNPEAVVVADVEGNVLSWNPQAEKLFGYTYEDVKGKNLDVFLARDSSIIAEALENTVKVIEFGQVHISTKRTHKDGHLVDVELLALPIYVEGEQTGFIAIYHDLTEIKRIENELRGQNEKMEHEMVLAGDIQRGFVGGRLPKIQGWDVSAKLLPANETSGDFYAVRGLQNGKVYFLIVDVVDKGVGAALIMALTWTLFRVAALEFGTQPCKLLDEVNKRIIKETKSDQFLTAFFGVLDTESGTLKYANAGHSPAFIYEHGTAKVTAELKRTGMPLGVTLDESWEEKEVNISEDEMLLLYTDGITEGINDKEEAYGEKRLIQSLKGKSRISAKKTRISLLDAYTKFTGEQAQFDDIALIVLKRAR